MTNIVHLTTDKWQEGNLSASAFTGNSRYFTVLDRQIPKKLEAAGIAYRFIFEPYHKFIFNLSGHTDCLHCERKKYLKNYSIT